MGHHMITVWDVASWLVSVSFTVLYSKHSIKSVTHKKHSSSMSGTV